MVRHRLDPAITSYRLGTDSSTTSSLDRLIEGVARDVELVQSLGHLESRTFEPNRAVGRRRLALAHELGHYLIADEYTVDWRVGTRTDSHRTEFLLDAFARALLMPADSLLRQWGELVERESVRVAAVRIASMYRVDMSTLAARLSDLELATRDQLSLIRDTRTTYADIIENDLAVSFDLEGTTLPRRYEKAVLALFRSERISAERAIDLLHGTVKEAGLPAGRLHSPVWTV